MIAGDDDDKLNNGVPAGEWNAAPLDELRSEDPVVTERLALNEGEEALPWLESGEDDDDLDAGATGRLLGLVALGVIVLGLLVGAIWWFSHRGGETLVADGSTIEAPPTPYKQPPANPGGKTFAGTGDSSFAVSEGQTRPAKLDNSAPAPAPAPEPKPSVAAGPTAAAAAAGGVGVQVGAYSSQSAADAGWATLVQQHSALSGLRHRVVQGKADIGTVYRLQAVAADQSAANALCGKLKSAGLACQVK